MGLQRIRADSVAALRGQKSRAELQAENERLKEKVSALEGQLTDTQIQLTDTQLAICEVFEVMTGGDDNG